MAAYHQWYGAEYRQLLEKEMVRRLSAAAIYLTSQIQADISQPGTLRYQKGKHKSYSTVYQFTHSAPGNPPYKQHGYLRDSITYEVIPQRLVARVGTPEDYGLYLEMGTRKMAQRPYLRRNLVLARATLRTILLGRIRPGSLKIVSNQSRSGVTGRGFGRVA
jgi:hypothetical protein